MTNRYIKLFGFLVALGLIANLIFALPAFVAPQFVVRIFDLGSLDQNVWLRHVGKARQWSRAKITWEMSVMAEIDKSAGLGKVYGKAGGPCVVGHGSAGRWAV